MRRKLGRIEAIVLAFGDHFPNHFALAARLKGELSIGQLRAALTKVCQRHVFLAARVHGIWYETEGVAEIPIIPFTGDWTDAIAQELPRLFDNKTQPRLCFLLNTDGEQTDLVLIMDHAVADGLSAAYVLRDVLHYVAQPDEVVIPLESMPPIEHLLPPADLPLIEPGFPSLPDEMPPVETPVPRSLFVIAWTLTDIQTDALALACREHEVTVHAALCAAFLSVYARLDNTGSMRRSVSSPVNVRKRLMLPVGEQLGDYINTGVLTYLDCTPGRDFWDMAHDVKTSLRDMTSDAAIFGPIYAFHKMIESFPLPDPNATFFQTPPRAEYDLSISNLGRLDFPITYGTLELLGIFGPMLNSVIDETIVGVATVGGRMTFSLVSRPTLMPRSTAENIRDEVNLTLANNIGWE